MAIYAQLGGALADASSWPMSSQVNAALMGEPPDGRA